MPERIISGITGKEIEPDCLSCEIVQGRSERFTIWETPHHLHVVLLPVEPWMRESFGQEQANGSKKLDAMQAYRDITEYAKTNLRTPENIIAIQESTEQLHEYMSSHFSIES